MQKLIKDIDNFISGACPELLHENANKAATEVTTHRDLLAGIVSKHIFINHVLPEDLKEWHEQGYGHIHDCDYALSPLTNCQLVNYPDMLENGFSIGDARIEPPRSIGVASTVLTQIIQAVACAQYGGQTIAHIDRYLAPYVQKSWDKLLVKQEKYGLSDEYIQDALVGEVQASMQSFIYQVNSLCTTNGQAAFVSLSFGLETSIWGRMITEQYLKCHMQGLGKDQAVPVFPKVIFVLQEGINLNQFDANYDLKKLAIQCSATSIYPDYLSAPLVKRVTGTKSDVTSPMGCRSFLGQWVNSEGKEQLLGRMNIGVVSVNLPLLALEADEDVDTFFEMLDLEMDVAYQAQMFRVNRLLGTKAKQNPIMYVHGAIARLDPESTIDHLLFDGRSSVSIGYVGLSETIEFLGCKGDKNLAMHILERMNIKCEEFKAKSRLSFSLYGTPAESLCYKFARAIHSFFPGRFKKDYLTNSFHMPVSNDCDPIEKWEYEEGFPNLSPGGFISYIEQPSLKHNLEAYESFVDYAYKRLPYFGINTPIDSCFKCGCKEEFKPTLEGFKCPNCGNDDPLTINVIRRVSGYLSSPNSRAFNKGKQQEVMERVKHT